MKKLTSTQETMRSAMISRRSLLKASVAVGAVGFASPIYVKNAFSSSGEVNFTGWAGYPALAEKVFPAFTAATGIKVNFTEQPDNDGIFAAAKVASTAGGIDMIEPTIDTVGQYSTNGLVHRGTRPNWRWAIICLVWRTATQARRISDKEGKLLYVPSTGAQKRWFINKEKAVLGDGKAKLGCICSSRPKQGSCASAFGARCHGPRCWKCKANCRVLGWMAISTWDAMVQLWDMTLAECVKAKANVVQFWAGENEANAGFVANGATLDCAGIQRAIICAMTAMAMPLQLKARLPGIRVLQC